MSGQYCGGCGEGDLLGNPGGKGKQPVVCDLCGWTADRADLFSEWFEDGPPRTKRARKAAGTLFFLWIDVDPSVPDVVFAVMKVLKLTGMNSGGTHLLVELGSKPSEDVLARLAQLKGVTGVRLVP